MLFTYHKVISEEPKPPESRGIQVIHQFIMELLILWLIYGEGAL